MELTPAALTIASNLPVVPAAFLYEIPEFSSTRREEISAPWILNAAEAGAKSCVAARRRQGSICKLTRPVQNRLQEGRKREKKKLRESSVSLTQDNPQRSALLGSFHQRSKFSEQSNQDLQLTRADQPKPMPNPPGRYPISA
jgi:hypothetical protein